MIEQQATVAIDKFIDPFKNFTTDRLKDWGETFYKSLMDAIWSILYAAVMILVKYFRDEILGSLSTDLCNKGTPSLGVTGAFTSLGEYINDAPMYDAMSEEQVWDSMSKKFQKIGGKAAFNMDIQSLIGSFEKMDEMLSPHEMKRVLYNTPCGDNSADDLYELIQKAFTPEETLPEVTRRKSWHANKRSRRWQSF